MAPQRVKAVLVTFGALLSAVAVLLPWESGYYACNSGALFDLDYNCTIADARQIVVSPSLLDIARGNVPSDPLFTTLYLHLPQSAAVWPLILFTGLLLVLGIGGLGGEELQGLPRVPRGVSHWLHLTQGLGGVVMSVKGFVSNPLTHVCNPVTGGVLYRGIAPAIGFYLLVAGIIVALVGLYAWNGLVERRGGQIGVVIAALLALLIPVGYGLTHDPAGTTVCKPALTATPTPVPPGRGLLGAYYRSTTINWGTPVPDNMFGQLLFTQVDPQVDIRSGDGQYPDPRLGGGAYAIRWTGQIRPRTSETYTIVTHSDDGVRLWINGQLLIDDWSIHADKQDSATIPFTAGQFYDIKLEYYENNVDGAVMVLEWQSASQQLEVIPAGQLYPGRP